ncbi:RNA polymerase sigma factor [Capnocytophaga sp.]|uniref:RNA polymerase sigma factor n=1 Tax=Capnocytophaga sp. TaxID=44737 RepID=UPI0026DB2525|nr:sigma-70 family RNA polymerase sigma factor [Capnocytophaga sp.]MDO5105907.1 sigma-70 family RNA polymerase sigma factor [Capnocytophaga sp.]
MTHEQNKEFQRWIESYSDALLQRAGYMLSDKEAAQDVVQEVFLAAYTRLHTFKEESSPLTWLQSILRNKIADFYRVKYKQPAEISVSHFFDENGDWINREVTQGWETPFEAELDVESALYDCIEKLPPRWKTLVKLYYLEQKKNEAVCQETGVSSTNLWKILQRSRLQLRECLEQNAL